MIAADTSTWIAFLQGERGEDTDLLDQALGDKQVVMVPMVLTELLSDPNLDSAVRRILAELPLLETRDGFWLRAGMLRSEVLNRRRKARLGDALIAQFCVDHDIPLVTRDRDFRAFAESADINVVAGPRKR
jgi:predicted nucleic acid-binding protein